MYFKIQLKWEACIWVLWDVISSGVKTARKTKEFKGKTYTSANEFHLFSWQVLELKRNTGKQNRKGYSPIHSYSFRKPTMRKQNIMHRKQLLPLSRLPMMRGATVSPASVHKPTQTLLARVLVGKMGPRSLSCTLEFHYVIFNAHLYWGSFPRSPFPGQGPHCVWHSRETKSVPKELTL